MHSVWLGAGFLVSGRVHGQRKSLFFKTKDPCVRHGVGHVFSVDK
jgi:hypothetical protein